VRELIHYTVKSCSVTLHGRGSVKGLFISDETKEQLKSDKKQIDIGKEAAIEAEVRAARERAIVPLEIRIKSFKEMLAEKEVIAFTSLLI